MLEDLSIIIPVARGDIAWKELLPDLRPLPPNAEVLLVGADSEPNGFRLAAVSSLACTARWLHTKSGRARQLNHGADNSRRKYLWFLHADSRVDSNIFEKLEHALCEAPKAIHYFELGFQSDGPSLTRLNAWGANLRSRFLHLPFGDQGFCLSNELFCQLGRFDESVPEGEDHLWVWKAHRKGVPVKSIAARISTSARKYRRDGWLRTTCCHLVLTCQQAVPELARWLLGSEGES
jgi:rSAM/selenodomain-associated transferase 2